MNTFAWSDSVTPDNEGELAVLVAVVPRVDDWAHIVNERWYHLPMARAPRRIAVDRVAFYHPACFAGTAHTVSYYADVRGYELLPRRALFADAPAHPRADQLYYRLWLGPVLPLPWPVRAERLRRITFINTNWTRLLQAQDAVELWTHESLSARLGRELREPAWPYLAGSPALGAT